MKGIVTILFLLITCSVHASTIAVLTDEPSGKAAKNLIRLIEKTPPFSRMPSLKLKLVRRKRVPCDPVQDRVGGSSSSSDVPPSCQTSEARAGANASLQRLLVCSSEQELANIQAEENADFMVFVKASKTYGGSGGAIPIVTSSAPASTGLHELLHRFGFADEYQYVSACEADLYCRRSSANVAVFKEAASYASDDVAKQLHAKDIPWFSQIKVSTKITSGNELGTADPAALGLHPAETCKLASGNMKSWKPSSETTIMEGLWTNYIPESYWPTIASALGCEISESSAGDEVQYGWKLKNGKTKETYKKVKAKQNSQRASGAAQ